LTGTKYGCGEGQCGACTVLVDGNEQRSCQLRVGTLDGRAVRTIEGLANGDRLHPLQQAFLDHGALQCGLCTPGMHRRRGSAAAAQRESRRRRDPPRAARQSVPLRLLSAHRRRRAAGGARRQERR
jgi:aerobic-type carbon monoxide dehydrogenase small subunit (CoxS/CutS family)